MPFVIRAGKEMPVTATEVLVRFRQPPAIYSPKAPPANYFRFTISPEVVIALGMQVLESAGEMEARSVELMVTDNPRAGEMGPYERLLTDALRGDSTLFAREDSVEEAWRIVDPVIQHGTPIYEYDPGTWGPVEMEKQLVPPGGWQDPEVAAG